MDVNSLLAWLASLLKVILVNLILSGDNALIIGMAARNLLPLLRRRAIIWGTVGAILLRILLTGVASFLIQTPLLAAVGGLLLVWIALKLLWQDTPEGEGVEAGQSLWEAIKIIIMADAIMSFDNMLAVAAASKMNEQIHLELLIFGLILSMSLLMVGAALVASLLNRWPWLTGMGAAVVAWTGGDLILSDPYIHGWPLLSSEIVHWAVPLIVGAAVLAYSFWLTRQRRRRESKKPNAPRSEERTLAEFSDSEKTP